MRNILSIERRGGFFAVLALTALLWPAAILAEGGTTVNLPYQQTDAEGNSWAVFQGGWLRQNTNQPLYGQGAIITINGSGPDANTNSGQIDPKTGELVLDNLNAGGFPIIRRILIAKDLAYVRYIDIIKNPQQQAVSINFGMQTQLNFGVVSSALVDDPKRKDSKIAWAATTPVQRTAVEMYAGKGSRVVPTISYQPNNTVVQTSLQLTLKPGQQVAIMHLHSSVANLDAATQWVQTLNETKALQSIPPDVRRLIVNFSGGMDDIGGTEVLRGDILDVIELRGGDQVKGTLQEKSYKINTFYGSLELPVDQVIGMINVGQFRPRQLLITADGQIFGGHIDRDSISLQMSSGQVVSIPLSQIARFGYHKRPNEPEEWTFDKPMVLMRGGERVLVTPSGAPIDVVTRYGVLKLDPNSIANIVFQSDDSAVHTIYLTDGSKFSGLVAADQLETKLPSAGDQTVKFPLSSLLRLQLAGKSKDIDDSTPTVSLTNDDQLVGSLSGALKLDTAFDTLAINAPEIRRIAHAREGAGDVQITLWDNTTVSGQLEEQDVQCQLGCGAVIRVPVALIQEYNQPLPQPSAIMIEKIKAAVAQLNVDDWKQRQAAQNLLMSTGSAVIPVLKQLRAGQPPEGQTRIDKIVQICRSRIPEPGHPAVTATRRRPI